MRDQLRFVSIIVFIILLVVSVGYNLATQVSPISWPEIIVVVVILFIATGDKFTKVMISPKEISIEQMVQNLEKDVQKIDKFIEEDNPTDKITDIIDDTLEHPRDIWSKLLIIRITLRRLLRKIADVHKIDFYPTTSISRMMETFRTNGIIDDYLFGQIERIRDATFTVEWGAGKPPNLQDIRFTLENYEKVFNFLKERSRPPSD